MEQDHSSKEDNELEEGEIEEENHLQEREKPSSHPKSSGQNSSPVSVANSDHSKGEYFGPLGKDWVTGSAIRIPPPPPPEKYMNFPASIPLPPYSPPSLLPVKYRLNHSLKRRPYLIKYGRYRGKSSNISYDIKSKSQYPSSSPLSKDKQSYDDLVKQYSELRKEKIGHSSKKQGPERLSRHKSAHKKYYKENHLKKTRTSLCKKEKRKHGDSSCLEPLLDDEDPTILELRRAALESCSKLRSVVKLHKDKEILPKVENCKSGQLADVNTRLMDMEISDSEIVEVDQQDDSLSVDCIDELLEEHLLRTEALKTLNQKPKSSLKDDQNGLGGLSNIDSDEVINSNDESHSPQNEQPSEPLEVKTPLPNQSIEIIEVPNVSNHSHSPSPHVESSQLISSTKKEVNEVEKPELAHTSSQQEAIMLERLFSDVSDRYSRPSTPTPSTLLEELPGPRESDAPLPPPAPTSGPVKTIPTTSSAHWWPSIPAKPLVINLKDDTSSSENSDDDDDGAKKNNLSQAVDNFLLKARKEVKGLINGGALDAPLPVAPLSKAQQQEYLELKNEISKREGSQKVMKSLANRDSHEYKKRLLFRKAQETKIKLESARNLLKKDTMEFESTRSELEECKNSILNAKREMKLLESKLALVKNKVSFDSLRFRKLTTQRAYLGLSLKKTTNTLQLLKVEYNRASKQLLEFSQNIGEVNGVLIPGKKEVPKTTTTPTKKSESSASNAIIKNPPTNASRQNKYVARKTIQPLNHTPEKSLEKQTLLQQEETLRLKMESMKNRHSPKSPSVKLSPLLLKESVKRAILPHTARAFKSLPHPKEPPAKMAKLQPDTDDQVKEIKTDILQTISFWPNISLPCDLSPFLPKMEGISLPQSKSSQSLLSRKPLLTSSVHYTSPLLQLASYRFEPDYQDATQLSATHFVHGLNPKQKICRFDLLGTCTNSSCKWQHASEYVPTDDDILFNLLSYYPQVANVSYQDMQDKDLSQAKFKMKAFVKDLKKENPSKSLEELCVLLMDKINHANKRDTSSLGSFALLKFPELKLYRPHTASVPDEISEVKPKKPSISELLRVFDLEATFETESEEPLEDNTVEDARAGRYFATDLEEVVRHSPHYIAAWLQLAAHQFDIEQGDVTRQLSLALNVLSRGLELNRSEWRLWLPYLALYKHHHASASDMPGMCLQASQLCPHPKVFWKGLELLEQFEHKDCLAHRFMIHLCSQLQATDNPSAEDSHQLLKIVLYLASLHQQTGRPAVGFFKKLVFSSSVDHSQAVMELLLDEDRSFAWLCFIHLACFQFLPDHLFDAQNLVPSSIRKPFYIPWESLPKSFKFDAVLALFKEAIASCSSNYESLILLMENLLCLDVHLQRDANSSLSVQQIGLLDDSKFTPELWRLVILIYSNLNMEKEAFEKVQKASLTHPLVWHALAQAYHKKGNAEMVKSLLWLSVLPFFDEDQHCAPDEGHLLYCKLLGPSSPTHHLSTRKSLALDDKTKCYLWLNYLLFLQVQESDSSVLEEKYELALCSTVSSQFLEVIWWQYLHFFISRVSQSKNNNRLYEKLLNLVRRSLSTINNEDFHNRVLKLYFDCLPSPQHLSAEMVSLSCSWPCNRWLLEKSLFHLVETKDFNKAWSLLHSAKKSSLSLNAYKLAISLSEWTNDHHQVHMWFDRAIQAFPYSAKLWKTHLKYELSLGHPNHLKHLLSESSRLQIHGLEDYSKDSSQPRKNKDVSH